MFTGTSVSVSVLNNITQATGAEGERRDPKRPSASLVLCSVRARFVPPAMMMILLLFLQKQNLASAIYLFGLGTRGIIEII
jgi:hypothetical protein